MGLTNLAPPLDGERAGDTLEYQRRWRFTSEAIRTPGRKPDHVACASDDIAHWLAIGFAIERVGSDRRDNQ